MRIAFALLTVLILAWRAHASEEEYVNWTKAEVVADAGKDAGRVSFSGEVAVGVWKSVEVEAFGKKHKLSTEQRSKLTGFPLNSLKITHEAGYVELGGHTVHFRLSKQFYRDKSLFRADVIVSISKGKGLSVSDPGEELAERPTTQAVAPLEP